MLFDDRCFITEIKSVVGVSVPVLSRTPVFDRKTISLPDLVQSLTKRQITEGAPKVQSTRQKMSGAR